MKLTKKFKNIFHPKRMFKVNLFGVLLNVVLAIIAVLLGLHKEFMEIFVLSGFCFFIGLTANMWLFLKEERENKIK